MTHSSTQQSLPQAANGNLPHARQVIVFSRYPEAGRTKTRLIASLGADRAAQLQQALSRYTFERTRDFCVSADGHGWQVRFAGGSAEKMAAMFGQSAEHYQPQVGTDLGQRLQHATRSAFDRGASRVVVIGTDCPAVEPATLASAMDKLSKCDVVLGPAVDGGYYLVGMREFQPQLFADIAWGSDRVLDQTVAAAKRAGCRVGMLGMLADVDQPEDLVHCRRLLGTTDDVLPEVKPRHWSIVIPTLNEQTNLPDTLDRIPQSPHVEVIIADAGSTDATVKIAEERGATVVQAGRGRGRQMNAGAALTCGQWLMFLHADTLLPKGFLAAAEEVLARGAAAGGFELQIDGDGFPLRWIERGVRWRSRFFQQPYGDQALFMAAVRFFEVGGFPNWPLMEDVELVRRLRRLGRIEILKNPVVTSARRWRELGIARTTAINQLCRLGLAAGVSPERLAKIYRHAARRRSSKHGSR